MDNKDYLLLDVISKNSNNELLKESHEQIVVFDLYEGKKIVLGRNFGFFFRVEKFMEESILLKLYRVNNDTIRLECNEYYVVDYRTVNTTKVYYNSRLDVGLCTMRLRSYMYNSNDNNQEIINKNINGFISPFKR